jgi:hypothetical protein
MKGTFDALLDTLEEYADARSTGDEEKARESRSQLRTALSAFVVEAVRSDYMSNGSLRGLLRDDHGGREIREGRTEGAGLSFHLPRDA